MKKFTILVVMFVILLLPISGYAGTGWDDAPRIYTITLHNTDAAHTVVFLLYHIDHGTHHAHDVIPVGGEIPPLGEISTARVGGLYYVVWKEQHTGNVLKATKGFRLDKHMEFYYP